MSKTEQATKGRHVRKQGGQAGHAGTQRKLVTMEQVRAEYDVKPIACRKCGKALRGDDPTPDRHPVGKFRQCKWKFTNIAYIP